ncbi:cytochrome P450 [Microbacterium yannicii]|uniref:cytochrome P450 n=1 Tax=Microbacterium yannicii TaxID=671622 RepID=UPI0002F495DB|nr:cytochrome P450 [Microbacterium yannicii]
MDNTRSSQAAQPRIAIVGSGPSGCYMAQFLRRTWADSDIAIYDRLDTPFGLIRYGVAPDHLGTKGIAKQFDRLFEQDGVRFLGGVEVGTDISIEALRAEYDAVVLATGLWADRTIDGFHDANGAATRGRVYGSGEVTRMINAHPGRRSDVIRIGRRTVIVGNGNVAADLVRLFLSSPERLREVGVPDDAIKAVGTVERIDVVGRSGADQAKFDVAMVRELGRLADVRFTTDADRSTAADSPPAAAVLEIVDASPAEARREVHFSFGWTPDHLEGDADVELAVFRDSAGTGKLLAIEADSVCTAVGFREIPTDVLLRSTLESDTTDIDAGVLGENLYCVGWVRRGPVGTIPANRADARAVAARIIADLDPEAAAGASPVEEEDAAGPGEIVVLYGTESGNAETIADVLVEEFSDDLKIRAIDMTDATAADLRPGNLTLVICSTHGEGAMPSSAKPFAALLDAEQPDLTDIRYAMFGLGDSSYEFYSRGSEHIDARLAALGATRVADYGRHDAVDGTLPNDRVLEWARVVVADEVLASDVVGRAAAQATTDASANALHEPSVTASDVDTTRIAGITTAVQADSSLVPRDLTLHYDPFSYADYDYPYDLFKRLRDEAPVYYNEERGVYFVSRYADVRACLADTKRFSSARGNDIDGTHDSFGEGFLVTMDAPRHTALRAAIRRTFSVREILAKEDGMREYIRHLLAAFWDKGGGDFTAEVGFPIGVGMAVMLLGRPMSDVPDFVDHIERELVRVVGAPGVPDDAVDAVVETEAMIADRFAARKAEIEAGVNTSASDAMTQITLAVHAGKVSSTEQVGLAHLVLAAASDAPASFMGQIIMILDRFPTLQPFLRENPALIPAFIEECLRYDTPGQNVSRQTTEDVEVAGTVIPANSRVTFLQGSANRDERVYDNPDVFDLAREITPANRIMSFGEGPHACMGAPFLRLCARVLVEELVQGQPVRIVGLPERFSKQLIRGFAKLPVRFAA